MDTKDIITIVVAIFGSTGLWTFLLTVYNNRIKKKTDVQNVDTAVEQGLLAVLHELLYHLCDEIIEQGYITQEQLERINYLKPPYFALGGNSTLKHMLEIIDTYKVVRR